MSAFRRLKRFVIFGVLLVVGIVMLFPFVYMLQVSFRSATSS